MDPKNIIETLLTYGKGPLVRALAWVLVALLGKYGVDAAKAGDFINTLWPMISALLIAVVSFAWSVKSDAKLHQAEPPKDK